MILASANFTVTFTAAVPGRVAMLALHGVRPQTVPSAAQSQRGLLRRHQQLLACAHGYRLSSGSSHIAATRY